MSFKMTTTNRSRVQGAMPLASLTVAGSPEKLKADIGDMDGPIGIN